ncbi:MAG: thymidine phosphorylase [Chloroflexota bacterium]
MRVVDIIDRKRTGHELAKEEIEQMVFGYTSGEIPDYQLSAWLMAICCRGMSLRETVFLTMAMVNSGAKLELSEIPWPVVDKHSTGGVGDKTTLVVAPLARACGMAVGKMSGRGLGFTGGTLDKLEAIPGYKVDLTAAQFLQQLRELGIVVSGQTPDLVPADKKIYALRDVTGTVESIPLIASSIMSKKLAVGTNGIVLDVKVGSGAFMKTREEAEKLAGMMVEIGTAVGKRVSALLSPMDEPLGLAVGNTLEVAEAIETLQGQGPPDLVEVSTKLVGEMLWLMGLADTPETGKTKALLELSSGNALKWFGRWVATQGGDRRVLESPSALGRAPKVIPVISPKSGRVSKVDALGVARAALLLGAGRARKGDKIDPLVGVVLRAKAGSDVMKGDLLAEVHARDEAAVEMAIHELIKAYIINDLHLSGGPSA